MQEKSFINAMIKTIAIATIAIIVVGQVEVEFTVSKKRFNIFESIVDTGKTVYKGYKIVSGQIN